MSSSDLEQQETPESKSNGVSRRDVIKRGLVIGGATYVVPAVVSMVSPLGAFAATPTPTASAGVNLVPCTVALQPAPAAPTLVGVTGTVIGVIQPLTQSQSQSQSQSATATATASSTLAVRVTIDGIPTTNVVSAQSHEDELTIIVSDRLGNVIPGLAQLIRRDNGSVTIDVQGTANASASAGTVQVQTQREMQIGGVVVPAGVIIFQTVVVPCVIPIGIVLPIGTVTRTVTQTVTRTATATLPGCTFALVPNAILGTGVTGVASVLQGATQTQTQSQSQRGTATATASSAFTVRVTVTGLNNVNAGHLRGTVDGGGNVVRIQQVEPATVAELFASLRSGLTVGSPELAAVDAQIAVLARLDQIGAACERLAFLRDVLPNQEGLDIFLSGELLLADPNNLLGPLSAITAAELVVLRGLSRANLLLFIRLCNEEQATVTRTVTNTVTGTVTQTVTNTVTGTVTQTVTNTVTGTVTQTVTNTVTGTQTVTQTVTNTATGTQTVTQTVTQTATGTQTGTGTQTVTRTITQTATGTANNGTIVIDITGTANASAAATTVQVQAEQQTQAVNAVTGAPIVIPAGTILFSTVVTNSPCIFR